MSQRALFVRGFCGQFTAVASSLQSKDVLAALFWSLIMFSRVLVEFFMPNFRLTYITIIFKAKMQ